MLRELFDYAAIGGKVHAMLGNRLRQEDFDKLMQMHTVPETAAFLLNTPGWGNCLQGMDVEHVHRGELEKRLRMGLAGEYDRLATFASKGMRQLLRAMAAKAEAVELLRFLRYFSAGHPADFAVSLPAGLLRRSHIRFDKLAARPDYQGLLQAVEGTVFYSSLKKTQPGENGFDYTMAEAAVQSAYYRGVLPSIQRAFHGEDRRELEEYFLRQCDFQNIVRILRMKRYFKVESEEVLRGLLPFSLKLKDGYLKELIKAPTWDEAMSILKDGPYGPVFREEEHRQIEDYAFSFFQKGRQMIRRGRPSAFDGIIYLDIKEHELKNIINLVECVRYQVPENRRTAYLTPIY